MLANQEWAAGGDRLEADLGRQDRGAALEAALSAASAAQMTRTSLLGSSIAWGRPSTSCSSRDRLNITIGAVKV